MKISFLQPVPATLLAALISLSACTPAEEPIVVPFPVKTSGEIPGRLTLIYQEGSNRMVTSATRPGESMAIPLGQLFGFGRGNRRGKSRTTVLIPGANGSEICIKGTAKGAQTSITAIGDARLCFHKTEAGWVYLSGRGKFTGEKSGTLGQERSVASCVDTLDHTDEILRRGCARDLGRLASLEDRDDVAEALTESLTDEKPGVREAAAETLGQIDCHNSFDALRKARDGEKNKIALQYMREAIAVCAGKAWLGTLSGLQINQAEAAKLYSQGATSSASKQLLETLEGDPAVTERAMAKLLLAKNKGEQSAAVSLLFALDAKVRKRQNMGGGALHYAALSGRLDTVKTLLDRNPAPNPRSNSRLRPIHYAAQEGHADVVSYLASHGANVNFKFGIRGTPLHLAAKNGHLGAVEALINHGADVNVGIKGIFGTPLGLAKQGKYTKIVRLLTIYGARERNKRLVGSANKPRPEVIDYLKNRFPTFEVMADEILRIMTLRSAHSANKTANKQFEKKVLTHLQTARQHQQGPAFHAALTKTFYALNSSGYDELACVLSGHVMTEFAEQGAVVTGKLPSTVPYTIKRKCGLLKK